MKQIKIYIKPGCPYCERALEVLHRQEGTSLEIIDITDNVDLKQQMQTESGGRSTVPQIFVDGKYLGDCSELLALQDSGDLKQWFPTFPNHI